MEELSFLEKLAVLGNNILAHPIFILLLLSPIVIFILNKKITRKIVILIYVVILAIVLFVGNTTLFELLDNVIDGIFMVVYFPNFVTLFVVVVASAIITLVTFLKKKMFKANKIINIVGFVIVQTIFCLVLTVVQVNNIDIYEENALYSNSDVLTLMQLLTGTFALQVISILVVTAIEKVTKMLDDKDEAQRKFRNIERAKKLNDYIAEDLFTEEVEPKEEINIEIEPQAPLDRSLIKEEKLKPISLVDAISEEQRQNTIVINKPPVFESPIETLELEKEVPKEPIKENVKENTKQPKEEKPNKFVSPSVFAAPPVISAAKPEPVKEQPKPQTIKPEEPKEELITGLVILNLEKTIRAIMNIKRIYTM